MNQAKSTSVRSVSAPVLAVLFAWLGVAGLLNAVVWPVVLNSTEIGKAATFFPPGMRSPFLPSVALFYGITASACAVALWQMKGWLKKAYWSWVSSVLAFAVFFSIIAPGPLFVSLTFTIAVVALLAAGWLYVERVARGKKNAL